MLTGKKARQKYFQRDTVIVVNVNKPLRRSDGARARRDDGDRGRRIRRVGVGRGGAPTARRARARALGGVPAYARRRARPRSRALGTPSRARDERYPRDPRRGRCRPFLDRAGRVSRPPHRLRAFTPRPLGRRRFRRRRRRRRPPVSHLLLRRRGWSPVRAVSLSRHDAPRPRRVPGRLAQRERAREQRVVPRVRPVRLPLPHRARRVGVVPRRSQDGRSPRVDRRRRRGDARRNPLPRRLHARARASRRQGGPRASPRTGTLRIRGNTHVPPPSRARGGARRASPVARLARRGRDRRRARGANRRARALERHARFHLPASRRVCVLPPRRVDRSGAAVVGPRGRPRCSPVARRSPTRSTVSSPARSSSARRGAFGNYVESFAPTRGPCFSPSRRSSRVTASAPVDFFSSAAPRSRAPPRIAPRGESRARRSRDSASASSMYTWGCRRGTEGCRRGTEGCRGHTSTSRGRVVRL